MENYIVINGKKAELTEEQLEKLGIKIGKDIFNPKDGDNYYFVNALGELTVHQWDDDRWDVKAKSIGNCCMGRDIMQQRVRHEILERLLWRFSMQNDGQDLDWETSSQDKFYICYNYADHEFVIYSRCSIKPYNVCFISEEIAQEAIDTIVKPFMEKHPDFVW